MIISGIFRPKNFTGLYVNFLFYVCTLHVCVRGSLVEPVLSFHHRGPRVLDLVASAFTQSQPASPPFLLFLIVCVCVYTCGGRGCMNGVVCVREGV